MEPYKNHSSNEEGYIQSLVKEGKVNRWRRTLLGEQNTSRVTADGQDITSFV